MIPITYTAIYRHCREAYLQYKAQHEHEYNDELAKLHSDAEKYLKLSVDETENEVIVTFVLDKGDLDG